MQEKMIKILDAIVMDVNEGQEGVSLVKAEYRESKNDFIIVAKDMITFKKLFSVLSFLQGHTLQFYLEDKDTFIIF
jgi:hypothetical protein